MTKHSQPLRLAIAGSCLILIGWGMTSFVAFVQISHMNKMADELTQTYTPRNEFGHRANSYHWYK